MAKLTPDALIDKMSAWLDKIYGPRLQSLLVYGSAAGGNHHGRHSDINLLAVLDRIDTGTLDQAGEALRWWMDQGNPPLVMLSAAEVRDSADVFAIEFLDIRHNHRLLRGADLIAAAPFDPRLHRLQVEHDLRAQLLRLRARYLLVRGNARELERLLLHSFSTFLTLFRHALVAVGQPLRVEKAQVLDAAAARFELAPEPFRAILEARRSGDRLAQGELESLRTLFAAYLDGIQRVERSLEDYKDGNPSQNTTAPVG